MKRLHELTREVCARLGAQAFEDVGRSLGEDAEPGDPLPDAAAVADLVQEQFRELVFRHTAARGEGPYFLLPPAVEEPSA